MIGSPGKEPENLNRVNFLFTQFSHDAMVSENAVVICQTSDIQYDLNQHNMHNTFIEYMKVGFIESFGISLFAKAIITDL